MTYIAIFLLSIAIFYLYARLKGKMTERKYRNSQQFENRRKDFIDKINKMKK